MSNVPGIGPITTDIEEVRHSDEDGFFSEDGSRPEEETDEDEEARRDDEAGGRLSNA